MDLLELYNELEAEFLGAGAKLRGLQLLQLELRLGMNPSRSFSPIKKEQKLHNLEEALPEAPPATTTTVVRNGYTRRNCRLGHINKKCIKKLQQDGLLKLIDDESFDICVSCIFDKMERKPFTHVSERADDLLGIIHNDVCGIFRTTSREGANYYVTFTDDFSRYGYVYLIEHKHEVFEMFKTFQNEVANPLGKTIKALRSDRGGEYRSQEFLDHLKSHGIISQLTPSYTPKHNGVSERRNQTLLDMVKSMMSQTTLPMSFWGYAIESAARILNMVPTKKVNKTPYKMWHGKVLKLSYLKVSARIPQPPERYGFYINAEEHKLRDHGEPPIYRSTLSDPKSKKWLEAMNAEMQSMKDNQNILKYLRNTKDMFLIYGGDSITELGITCYTDVRWETNRDDLRSQTRFHYDSR
nr:retrotransposon protein, putative, Ty1-copia subclass [Tanacetum cinerariifolium]